MRSGIKVFIIAVHVIMIYLLNAEIVTM